eukprot:TRINITY_DN10804_c0_g3_i1.p2 TRINITY_DN10804_c0_g3~~TRINITY_DN10804_c0_g3_i1.p2  ORF type:complete len:115 (-),score=18.53 TRINITY_DN10804_c0_g3_i1:84-428(-)
MAYYRQDQFDVSLEIVEAYLREYPDSITGINLKACNLCHLRDKNEALECVSELVGTIEQHGRVLFGKEILTHNQVVFSNGHNAATVLKGLLDVIPEARLNMVVYYLKNGDVEDA